MKERYKPLFEKRWASIKLNEDITMSDLAKSAGMSGFTKKWRRRRTTKLAPENQLALLVDAKVHKAKGYVTFEFFTAPTEEDEATVVSTRTLALNGKKTVYTMKLRILDFYEWARTKPGYQKARELSKDELVEILEVANIQVFCNCPSFHWQGMNYVISTFDGSIHPTSIPPKVWNKKHFDDNFICKHLGGLINQYKFFAQQMAQMLKGKL